MHRMQHSEPSVKFKSMLVRQTNEGTRKLASREGDVRQCQMQAKMPNLPFRATRWEWSLRSEKPRCKEGTQVHEHITR